MAYLHASLSEQPRPIARKARSSNKGRNTQQSPSTVSRPEQGAVIRPRRGRTPKSDDTTPAEPSLVAAIAPGTERPARPAKDLGKAAALKARRSRKVQGPSASEPTLDDASARSGSDDRTAEIGDLAHAAFQADQPARTLEIAAELVSSTGAATAAAAPAAAHWDAVSGAVHFYWPAIEQVAGAERPN